MGLIYFSFFSMKIRIGNHLEIIEKHNNDMPLSEVLLAYHFIDYLIAYFRQYEKD